jgi:xanthine dehydrogenase accessory factor
MNPPLADEIARVLSERHACVMVTVAAVKGSVPRAPGAKMIIYPDGTISGTIGGGKFESLVVADAIAGLMSREPWLKSYPLHEGDAESFGAICGGEVTLFFEPQGVANRLHIVGAGHCAQALAKLAADCGWQVTVVDDRAELLATATAAQRKIQDCTPTEYIAAQIWTTDDALVLVSRNYHIDRDALSAALRQPEIGYIGMIGSQRKVQRVFEELKAAGRDENDFANVFAPIGLDLGADSPAEIAVSVMAEMLQVMRKTTGRSLRRAR